MRVGSPLHHGAGRRPPEYRRGSAAALPSTELRACVEQNLRRVRRRAQCVRAATWCLFPIVLLVAISIVVVRN